MVTKATTCIKMLSAAGAILFTLHVCIHPAEAMHMSQHSSRSSAGFQSLISTLCWFAGFGFTISGCFKLFQMFLREKEDPAFNVLKSKALFRLLTGFGLLALPFVLAPFYRTAYDGGYGHFDGPFETGAACYSSLPGHIRTLWMMLSPSFALAGARALYRADKLVKDDPLLPPLAWRVWIYFFLGVSFLVLPFLQAIYAQAQRPPVEYTYVGDGSPYSLLAYSCTGAAIKTQNFLRLIAALFWYCAAMGFYFSHFALGKALRFRGTPAEDYLNREAYFLLLTSFVATAVPFAGVALTGVELW
ncbi:MAG: hypothetical protein ACAH83_18000 [Alphaproteobacteria bacterium]